MNKPRQRGLIRTWRDKPVFSRRIRWYEAGAEPPEDMPADVRAWYDMTDEADIRLELTDQTGTTQVFCCAKDEAQEVWDRFKREEITAKSVRVKDGSVFFAAGTLTGKERVGPGRKVYCDVCHEPGRLHHVDGYSFCDRCLKMEGCDPGCRLHPDHIGECVV